MIMQEQTRVREALRLLNPERYEWLVTLFMHKLHALIAHLESFVREYRYGCVFSEECFEHFQQNSLVTRRRHSHNKSIGGQIFDDLTF